MNLGFEIDFWKSDLSSDLGSFLTTHLKASVSQIENKIYIIRLICQKYDTFLGDFVYLL